MKRGLVALSIVSACGRPHVTLQPPPPNLTPEQRIQAFRALEGVSTETIITRTSNRYGSTYNEHTSINLANGLTVHHAEDLLPLVLADSELARAVDDIDAAATRRRYWGLGAIAAFVGAAIVFKRDFDSGGEDTNILVPVLLGGMLVGAVGSWYYHFQHRRAVRRAFDVYNPSLAKRFGVCVLGLQLVPCEQGQPAN